MRRGSRLINAALVAAGGAVGAAVVMAIDVRWTVEASDLVAAMALVFTTTSFWWLYARRGTLKVSEPHRYALSSTKDHLRFRLPLTFFNSGARSIVVENLRLWFPGRNDVLPFAWTTTRTTLRPGENDGHAFPTGFDVPGRGAHSVIVEFTAPWPGFHITEAAEVRVVLEVHAADRTGWDELAEFIIRVPEFAIKQLGQFIAYDNTAAYPQTAAEAASKVAAEKRLNELYAALKADREPGPQLAPDTPAAGAGTPGLESTESS